MQTRLGGKTIIDILKKYMHPFDNAGRPNSKVQSDFNVVVNRKTTPVDQISVAITFSYFLFPTSPSSLQIYNAVLIPNTGSS